MYMYIFLVWLGLNKKPQLGWKENGAKIGSLRDFGLNFGPVLDPNVLQEALKRSYNNLKDFA